MGHTSIATDSGAISKNYKQSKGKQRGDSRAVKGSKGSQDGRVALTIEGGADARDATSWAGSSASKKKYAAEKATLATSKDSYVSGSGSGYGDYQSQHYGGYGGDLSIQTACPVGIDDDLALIAVAAASIAALALLYFLVPIATMGAMGARRRSFDGYGKRRRRKRNEALNGLCFGCGNPGMYLAETLPLSRHPGQASAEKLPGGLSPDKSYQAYASTHPLLDTMYKGRCHYQLVLLMRYAFMIVTSRTKPFKANMNQLRLTIFTNEADTDIVFLTIQNCCS